MVKKYNNLEFAVEVGLGLFDDDNTSVLARTYGE